MLNLPKTSYLQIINIDVIKIGKLKLENNLILAPMAGISNYAYRSICRKLGASLTISEMISSNAIYNGNKKTLDMLKTYPDEKPVGIQLFGDNVQYLVYAAKYIKENTNYDLIDINCGCPVPKIAQRSNAGAGLMREPQKIYEIIKAIKDNVDITLTIKIRAGWDSNSINAVEIAKLAQKAGVDGIIIHGRTRAQAYSGISDLEIIKKVKESVDIPVIGNGDIRSYSDYKKMIEYTKCDGVAIARAAIGNPWIFNDILNKRDESITDYENKKNMIINHLDTLLQLKGETLAVLEMRGLVSYYLKKIPNTQNVKSILVKTKTRDEFVDEINKFFDTLK